MTSLLATLGIMFLAGETPSPQRQPHPLAPSLPQLTREEEGKIQTIIDRFIQYDIGKLQGAEGRKALEDFHRLGPEAIFQLIDSFNQAANLEHSCPAVIIGKKIGSILNNSRDLELLTFAKDNIGPGVSARRHMGMVKDLQAGVLFRRGLVQRQLATSGSFPAKLPGTMTLAELAQAARQERGPRLQVVLAEASKRSGTVSFDILAIAAARPEKEAQDLAMKMLAQNVGQQKEGDLRKLIQHEKSEIRAAAAQACAARGWGKELLDLLEDPEIAVQKAAHRGLLQFNRGQDLGPATWTSPGDRATAVAAWRSWWTKVPSK
jgi:hypothetical protein